MCGHGERGNTILNRQTWQGLAEMVTSEQRLEAGEGLSYVDRSLGGKRCPRRSNRKLKGPETGTCHNIFFLKLPWLLVVA